MQGRRIVGLARPLLGLAILLLAAQAASAGNWPRFRGENGSGLSDEKGIPATWGPDDYAWNIELPGEGHSSPVIWGDRLFLTSAIDEGTVRYVLCLSAYTGEEVWKRATGMSPSPKHAKSSWASSTPATDGQRVYTAFADQEHYSLAAYDYEGTLLWRRNLGPYQSQHNLGASPIVLDDKLIVPNDQDGPSSIIALEAATGRTLWSTVRQPDVVSYATPLLYREVDGPLQLIASSSGSGVTSLDPATGRLNWTTGSLADRTVASPVLAGRLIVQVSGGGGKGTQLMAVEPPGRGAAAPRIPYFRDRELP
jgi:outer membrane protein assembly factor BamB